MINIHELRKGKTLLGVGAVSRPTVQATINLAKHYDIPILLIPSRRQVEAKELGGGYVMSTEELGQIIYNEGEESNIILERDHGSVYGGIEKDLSYKDSVELAKLSFDADIKSGFDFLHIDPAQTKREKKDIISDIYMFHDYCENVAKKYNTKIHYELGAEIHSKEIGSYEDYKELITISNELKNVIFCVGNIGNYVKERCNVGKANMSFAASIQKLATENNKLLKLHNCDYLDSNTLEMYRSYGFDACNVAPEFSVEETKCFLMWLKTLQMHKEHDDFVKMAYESKKWTKWMINGEHPDLNYTAEICGHYIMETAPVKEIKEKMTKIIGIPIDYMLTEYSEKNIRRYLRAFGWIKE
jgi:hypothetical protein